MTTVEVNVKQALRATKDFEVLSASRVRYFMFPVWRRMITKAVKVDDEPRYFFNLKNGDFVEVEAKGGPYEYAAA